MALPGTPETFVMTGGSLASTGDNVVQALAAEGVVAVNSSGTVTVTNSSLTGANGLRRFEVLTRIAANAGGAKLTYTVAAA